MADALIGLSRLQRHIIALAYRNKVAEAKSQEERQSEWERAAEGYYKLGMRPPPLRESSGADVYYHEILASYFGFRVEDRFGNAPLCNIRRRLGNQNFNRGKIGRKRYASAQASLSRAMTRLEARGLVGLWKGGACQWTGARLSAAGVVVAAAMVNTVTDHTNG